jgi:glycosyltransferase involved in cell wall biosynthesis
VKGVVDEIIVVDSHSTDKTREICDQYNVKFISQDWLGYSATKNLGNKLAAHDWILSLDADEALSSKLKNSILKEKQDFKYDAYIMRRMTNYCGKWIRHCGWYPDPKTRLWKKSLGEWDGDIHETINLAPAAKVGKLAGDILHYSISTIFQHIEQINKFSEIHSQSAFKKGKRSHLMALLLKPTERFFTTYLFKLGFLDGYNGFLISVLTAHSVFLRRVKLRQLWQDFERREKFE